MKKSQLNRIIKEVIREQGPTPAIDPCSPACEQILTNPGNGCKAWFSNLLSTAAPFSSPLPNQPCQFITNQIDNLQNQIANMNPNGPGYARKNCKLTAYQFLFQQNNC